MMCPKDANAVKEEVQMDLDKRLKLLRLDPELTLKPLQSLNEGHPPASMVSLAPAQFPRTGLQNMLKSATYEEPPNTISFP
eukprot:2147706-Amphidinium_carterae.1